MAKIVQCPGSVEQFKQTKRSLYYVLESKNRVIKISKYAFELYPAIFIPPTGPLYHAFTKLALHARTRISLSRYIDAICKNKTSQANRPVLLLALYPYRRWKISVVSGKIYRNIDQLDADIKGISKDEGVRVKILKKALVTEWKKQVAGTKYRDKFESIDPSVANQAYTKFIKTLVDVLKIKTIPESRPDLVDHSVKGLVFKYRLLQIPEKSGQGLYPVSSKYPVIVKYSGRSFGGNFTYTDNVGSIYGIQDYKDSSWINWMIYDLDNNTTADFAVRTYRRRGEINVRIVYIASDIKNDARVKRFLSFERLRNNAKFEVRIVKRTSREIKEAQDVLEHTSKAIADIQRRFFRYKKYSVDTQYGGAIVEPVVSKKFKKKHGDQMYFEAYYKGAKRCLRLKPRYSAGLSGRVDGVSYHFHKQYVRADQLDHLCKRIKRVIKPKKTK